MEKYSSEWWKSRDGFFKDGRKLKILGVKSNDGGCSYYRIISPLAKLAQLYPNVVEVRIDQNPLNWSLERKKEGKPVEEPDESYENIKWADVVFSQNISNFGGPYSWRVIGIAKENGKKVHYDTDDLLTKLYKGHRLEGVYKNQNLSEITTYLYNNSDVVTVTQGKFAERIEKYCRGTLAIIRNAVDFNLPAWNAPKVPGGNKTRIGWAGGIHHEEDLKQFVGIPNLVNQKVGKERLHWQFWGHPPKSAKKDDWQQEVWQNYHRMLSMGFKGARNYGVYNALPADQYGMIFSHFDVGIAPLQMNDFNDSKSDIKVAECYSADTEILMYDGSIKFAKDIQMGDCLMGPDSKPRKVLELFTGEDDFYKITPKRGDSIFVTGEHTLTLKTNRVYRDGRKQKNKTLEIKAKDYSTLSDSDKYDYMLYRTPIEFNTVSTLPLDPYFIGIMLGGGSFLKTPRITTMDEEVKNYFTSYTLSLGENFHINEYKNSIDSKAITYSCGNPKNCGPIKNNIIEELKKLKLYKISCKDKFIPEMYKVSSRENRLLLLAGLIDTDGTSSSNGLYSFSNTSEKLIDDVTFIARSLGFYVSPKNIQKKLNTKGGYSSWIRISISTGDTVIPCKIPRKIKIINDKKKKRNVLTSQFTIEKVKRDTYFGFKLDGDNLHVLADFTVMHNCGHYAVPLVASNVGCYEDTIINGQTGFLIEQGDKKDWIKKLTLLSKNKKLREEMGQNLKTIVDEHYDLNKVVHNRLTLYADLFPDEFTN